MGFGLAFHHHTQQLNPLENDQKWLVEIAVTEVNVWALLFKLVRGNCGDLKEGMT